MTFISVNPLEKIFPKNKMLEKTTHKKNKTLVSDVIKRGVASVIKNKGMWFCSAVDQLAGEQIAQILTQVPWFIA